MSYNPDVLVPRMSVDNRPHRRLAHAEPTRQSGLTRGGPFTADLRDILGRQLCGGVQLARTRPARKRSPTFRITSSPMAVSTEEPALEGSVSLVVSVRSEKQMIGPDARWVVAAMANQKPIGYGAEMETPRDTMGAFRVPSVRSEAPVSERIAVASPLPTSVRFRNLRPESILSAARRMIGVVAGWGAEANGLSWNWVAASSAPSHSRQFSRT